ncbi:MAG: hypothetical protein AAF500_17760 [Myxococcota bacterium]
MRLEDVSKLLTPLNLPYVNGVERLTDGVVHVAVRTPMPEVSPKMVGWWFGEYLQTVEHYRRWHPRDHVWMKWQDKQSGTYVGAKHLVHEYVGGHLHKLLITFVPPEDIFQDALVGVPETLAVCARPGLLERPVDVGYMVHLALPRPWGCELHSRFWLGYVASRNGSRAVEAIGNNPWIRRRLATLRFGRALAAHCQEEMGTLAGFLPELYASETSSANVNVSPLERGLGGVGNAGP